MAELKTLYGIKVAAIALLALGTAHAQNLPSIQYNSQLEIGPGVSYRTAWSNDPRWQIRIIEVDLSNPHITLQPAFRHADASLERTSAMADRYTALAGINAGYFGGSPPVSVSHYARQGSALAVNAGWRPPRSTFGLTPGFPRTLVQTRTDGNGNSADSDPNWSSVTDAIGGGPSLLTAGTIDIRDDEEGFDAGSGIGVNVRNPRTALGWNTTTQQVWLVTVDGRQSNWSVGMTLNELAQLLQDIGADRGMNYDGGGSTTAVANGSVINSPSDGSERPVMTAWLVTHAHQVDNLDPGFSTTGSWSSSANDGFFGSNSLFTPAGTGSNTATWTAELPEPGIYSVEAWWVAAFNRPPNAPYTVEHRHGSEVVLVDQTQDGSEWNVLGEFPFDEGTASVTLSNDVVPDTFVSADAVRWIRVDDLPDELSLGDSWMILDPW